MPNYEYMEVARPDRGLAGHIPDADISPRHCSDCQNVYFENGIIKKRFGYGAIKVTYDVYGDHDAGHPNYPTGYDKEIADMAVHESNLNVSTPTKRVYAFSTNDAFYWNPANSKWFMCEKIIAADTETWTDWATSGWNRGAATKLIYTDGGGSQDDCHISIIDKTAGDMDLRVEIDGAGAPDTFKWSLNNGGAWVDTLEPITGLPILLTNAGTDYCYVYFSATTGRSVGDRWDITFHSDGDPLKVEEDNVVGGIPEGSNCLKITVPQDAGSQYSEFIAWRRYSAQDWSRVKRITFYAKVSEFVLTSLTFNIRIFDDDASQYDAPMRQTGGPTVELGYGAVTKVEHTGNITSVWTRFTVELDDELGGDYTSQDRLIAIWINANQAGTDWYIYIDALTFEEVEDLGLDSNSTKSYPTLSTSLVASIDGATESYIVTTNFSATHYVRYINNDVSNTRWFAIDGANNATKGYNNNTNGSDYHKAHALSGFAKRLQLLANNEKTASGSAAVDMNLQVRVSNLLEAEEWAAGTAHTTFLADTSGRILNAKEIGGNNYIFKTDAIVQQAFLGGESVVFAYHTVYEEDSLLCAKAVIVLGDFCYWLGKTNIYRFAGMNQMEPIGDAIKTDLFSDSWLEKSNGVNHRRTFWLPVILKNLVLLCVPTGSTAAGAHAYPDKAFVYDPHENTWSIWNFADGLSTSITAGTSYGGLVTAGTETNLQRSVQFGNKDGGFYEMGISEKNDGSATYPITAWWTSKAFSGEKGRTEYTMWKGVHFEAKGDNVTVKYSLDGVTFTTVQVKTLTSAWKRYYVDFPSAIGSQLMYIQFYDAAASSTFEVRWFSLETEEGSAH